MTAKQAREAARQWMIEEATALPGFCAAYTAGSTNWLDDEATLPAASDLDIMLILNELSETGTRRKFIYQGALLEVSCLPKHSLQSSRQVLSDYHLAPSLRTAKIIVDPLGFLAPILKAVRRDYSKKQWVDERCANAKDKVLGSLRSVNSAAAFPDQAIAALFAAGITTHILLVAGLRNPTVRARYKAVRDLLTDYGHIEFHETLLELLGAAQMSRARASQHLTTLIPVFDAAQSALRTPFPFASDVSETARPIAIEGSLELIESGYHREAMFWIAVTHLRCLKILESDAPQKLTRSFKHSYQELLGDLALSTPAAIRQRCLEIERILPRVCSMAELIIAASLDI